MHHYSSKTAFAQWSKWLASLLQRFFSINTELLGLLLGENCFTGWTQQTALFAQKYWKENNHCQTGIETLLSSVGTGRRDGRQYFF